jgi:hypothetical protein
MIQIDSLDATHRATKYVEMFITTFKRAFIIFEEAETSAKQFTQKIKPDIKLSLTISMIHSLVDNFINYL